MKYPHYTRKQNLSCKLDDDDIAYIRRTHRPGGKKQAHRAGGKSLGELSEELDVGKPAIWRWVNEEGRQRGLAQAKKKNGLRRKIYHTNSKLRKHKIKEAIKSIQRKKKIHPQVKLWRKEFDCKRLATNERYKKQHLCSGRKNYLRHIEKYRKEALQRYYKNKRLDKYSLIV